MTTTIRLTRPVRSQLSRFMLPAGTIGHVIEHNPTTNTLMVNFGITGFAQKVDPQADYFEVIEGGVLTDAAH